MYCRIEELGNTIVAVKSINGKEESIEIPTKHNITSLLDSNTDGKFYWYELKLSDLPDGTIILRFYNLW